eukprot:scaffold185097_cov14-Tisochrysis_lutea.AAC.1
MLMQCPMFTGIVSRVWHPDEGRQTFPPPKAHKLAWIDINYRISLDNSQVETIQLKAHCPELGGPSYPPKVTNLLGGPRV